MRSGPAFNRAVAGHQENAATVGPERALVVGGGLNDEQPTDLAAGSRFRTRRTRASGIATRCSPAFVNHYRPPVE